MAKSDPLSLDMENAVKDILDVVRVEARRNEILLPLELATDVRSVSADRAQLQHVVLSLMLNAHDAMRSQYRH